MIKKIIRVFSDSEYRFGILSQHGFLNFIPDSLYLKIAFRNRMGRRLNLDNPLTFNEKLQFLKLHERNALFPMLVDKYEVKKYISTVLGSEYVIPTLGVYDCINDISLSNLPNQFVIKCTHDSGGIYVCKNKEEFDFQHAKRAIEKTFKHNYYYLGREWPYKSVKPRIIIEKYMEDKSLCELRDYKFFCFNGFVRCFKIDFDRFTNHRANYYDRNGIILPFGEVAYPPDYNREIEMPKKLTTMVELAEKLAKGFRFIRIDFYEVNGKVYFGEFTFYPASGLGKFTNDEWDRVLGSWIKL